MDRLLVCCFWQLIQMCVCVCVLSGTRLPATNPWRTSSSPVCSRSWTRFAATRWTSCKGTTWKWSSSSSRWAAFPLCRSSRWTGEPHAPLQSSSHLPRLQRATMVASSSFPLSSLANICAVSQKQKPANGWIVHQRTAYPGQKRK